MGGASNAGVGGASNGGQGGAATDGFVGIDYVAGSNSVAGSSSIHPSSGDSGGCGCRMAGRPGPPTVLVTLGVLGFAAAGLRRQRRRA